MLYGYREIVDNRVATLVVAATTVAEYDNFIDVVTAQHKLTECNFVEIYTSNFVQHMTEELYKGYKKLVVVFYHTDEAQRGEFIKEWNIVEPTPAQARDKQADMLHEQKMQKVNADKAAHDKLEAEAEARGEEYDSGVPRTIGQISGLDQHDPFDRRSDAQKAEDDQMKERIKEMKKTGEMSDDSFTGGKYADPQGQTDDLSTNPNGSLNINEVKSSLNEDGSINIDSIRVSKTGGPVDEALKTQREQEYQDRATAAKKGKTVFSPEDFAAVLAGDGSADHLDVKGDMDIRLQKKPMDRPSLSAHAEAARAEHQEAENKRLKERARQKRREDDIKAKHERENGIFRGADLGSEDDIETKDLPAELLEDLKHVFGDAIPETLPVKEYPFNSELGGKWLLPEDTSITNTDEGAFFGGNRVLAVVGAKVEGTISMGNPTVQVLSRDGDGDAWAVYGRTALEDGKPVAKDVSLVRLR